VARNVQSIIDDLESGLTQLRMHFESLGWIFGGSAKTPPRGRKARKTRFQTNKGRVDPYKNFKFRAKRHPGKTAAKTTGVAISQKMTAPAKKIRKKMTMSPALRKQRQLQGRYMGMVRRLPKAKQAQVKKVRKDKGYEAALKMMG
jgi:hypothetical protein